MNLIDVTKQFNDEAKCLDYLIAMRWPDGVRCTVCGNDKVSEVQRKATSKNKRNRFFICLEPSCKSQFSATTGTMMHDSHLGLDKWFMALAIIVDAKKGISALQLKKHLGIGSYRTAWYMYHRIRKAMEDPNGFNMTGVVEMDETYIGGKTIRRSNRGNRSIKDKDVVIGMRERGGRVKFVHTPDAKAKTVRAVVKKHLSPDVDRVLTDESLIYPIAFDGICAARHETVQHKKHYVVPGTDVHTNTIESAFSLLKRGLIGSYHRVSIEHLHRYLSEFEYRFNGRRESDLFSQTLQRMMNTIQMPYKQLISES